ncbi:hypothetical protein NDU88_006519 [Pleurodeles waltl]|uniref:Uncharacterized protein n=1 Tax=Pleurodeles waltl TaxID=8319 RepID=A0AAV7LX45_PLEWA|nr:hypothetical protein NDU88_006519 [Pleurodeles waltl]
MAHRVGGDYNNGYCSGASSVDAARRSPGGTSSSADGSRGTSGAGLSDPEAYTRGEQNVETLGTTGLLNNPGVRGEVSVIKGAEAFHIEATEEGRIDHDAEDYTRKRRSGLGDSEAAKR